MDWRKRYGVRAMYAWPHGQRWRSVDAVRKLPRRHVLRRGRCNRVYCMPSSRSLCCRGFFRVHCLPHRHARRRRGSVDAVRKLPHRHVLRRGWGNRVYCLPSRSLCCRGFFRVHCLQRWHTRRRRGSVDAVLTLFHGALRGRWGDAMRRMPRKHHVASSCSHLSLHKPEQRASVFRSNGQRTCTPTRPSAIRPLKRWRGGRLQWRRHRRYLRCELRPAK